VESQSDEGDAFGLAPRYPIESVDNALHLLSMFKTNDSIRVKDAAQALGVATGTAHRLLAMLAYRGYISQDPKSKLYKPGAMLLSIGIQAIKRSDLRVAARPYLRELHSELDETVQLATLEGQDVHYLDGIESSKVLRVATRAGTLQPAHATSVGKALLAQLSTDELTALYPEPRLHQPTVNSIRSRSKLLRELEATRERGYAVNLGELEDGIGSVAVAALGRDGRAVAAVGAGAPLSRIDEDRIKVIAETLLNVVGRLSVELSD
jgi:DNA-binding IclR family transcriptional regulator